MDLQVRGDVKKFTRHLSKVQKKQVPFATARALTWTVKDIQKAIIKKIPSIFNVTRKWWAAKQPTGIKIIPAKKIRLIASVFTKAHWGILQEKGGTKRPHKSKNLIIPTDKVPKSRRKAGGASVMLKNKNVFSTKRGIYRRKGGKKRKNQTLELLYTKERTAQVQPRFNFKRMARRVAIARFKHNFFKSLSMALKSARR